MLDRLFLPLLALLACAAGAARADVDPQFRLPQPVERKVDYARDVEPILSRSCFGCHGGQKTRGGLRLDDGKAALQGGDSGPAIVPGKSEKSLLVQLAAGADSQRHMPPGD